MSPPFRIVIAHFRAAPVSGGNVAFTVTFSTPVCGVDSADFTLATSGTVTDASVLAVSAVNPVNGLSDTYTVTVAPGAGWGTLELDVADDDSITDGFGHPLGGPGPGNGNYFGTTLTPSLAFTSTNTITAGTVTAIEGTPISLSLGTNFYTLPAATTWQIDWGDGAVDTPTGGTVAASHSYTTGDGSYDISISNGYTLSQGISVNLLPTQPTDFAPALDPVTNMMTGLTWQSNSVLATGDLLEQSENGGAFIPVATFLGNGGGNYSFFNADGYKLKGTSTYNWRLSAYNAAGDSQPAVCSGTTPAADSGTLVHELGSGQAADLGFPINFYGTKVSTIGISSCGYIVFGAAELDLTFGANYQFSAGGAAIIAPFLSNVDTSTVGESDGGTVSYGPETYHDDALSEDFQSFLITWDRVDHNYRSNPSHQASYDTFKLHIINRSDTGDGNFDFVFDYGELNWDKGEPGDGSEFYAKAGYNSGSPRNVYAALPYSGTADLRSHLLADPIRHFEVRNPTVALNIDSDNNNGFDAPDGSATERAARDISGDPAYPGKILWVNGGDADGDGIPDWADGFGGDHGSQSTADASGHFVPVIVQLSNPNADAAYLEFNYNMSNPDAISSSVDGDGHTHWYNDGGALRIWTKDGTAARTTADDFIVSGQSYLVSALNATNLGDGRYEFFVEALNPSAEAGDQAITVTLRDSLNCAIASDQVRTTVLNWRFDEVNNDGSLTPVDGLAPTIASPEIQLTSYSIVTSTLHLSEDGLHILGDIDVAGTIHSLTADSIPGAAGTIGTAVAYLNGSSRPLAPISVSSVKNETRDMLHPYAYTGSFNTTLHNIELQPGPNTLRIMAADPLLGFAGYADANLPLTVTPPSTLTVQFYASTEPYATLHITFPVEGQPDGSVSVTLNQSTTDPNVYTGVLDAYDVAMTVQDPDVLAQDRGDSDADIIWHASITGLPPGLPVLGADNITLGKSSPGISDGIFEQVHPNYIGQTLTPGGVSEGAHSVGGEAHPYVIEGLGPKDVLRKVVVQSLDGAKSVQEGFNAACAGAVLICAGDWTASHVVHPAVNYVTPRLPAIENLAVYAMKQAPSVYSDTQNFGAGYVLGIPVGFGKEGWDMVSGMYHLAKWYGNAVNDATYARIRFAFSMGDAPFWSDSELRVFSTVTTTAQVLYQMSQSIQADQAAFMQMSKGNFAPITQLSVSWGVTISTSAELLNQLVKQWASQDSFTAGYQAGQIVGRVLFEVAAIVVPMLKIGWVSKIVVLDRLLELLKAGKIFEEGSTGADWLRAAFKAVGYTDEAVTVAGNTTKKAGSIAKMIELVSTLGKGEPETQLGRTLNEAYRTKQLQSPYFDDEIVYTIKLQKDARFYRAYSNQVGWSWPQGKWVTTIDEMDGLTASQTKDVFALPTTPTTLVPVDVPAGTTIRISRAGANAYGDGGRIQLEILDRVGIDCFKLDEATIIPSGG